jgi:WD40 repeat protein
MECTICYNKIEEGAGYNKWRCAHIFHKKCIIDWNTSCPVCRCDDRNYENIENKEYIETYGEISDFRGHTDGVNCLCAQAHNNKLFSGSDDKTIRVWNTETYEEIATLRGHTSYVMCLCAQAHKNKLFSGSCDIRVWNTETYEEITTLRGHTSPIICFALHNNKLFSGSYDQTIHVWNTETYEQIATLEGHTGPVLCFALHDNKLFSGSMYETNIRIWNTETYEQIATLKSHTISEGALREHDSNVVVRCLTHHGNKLYSGGGGGNFRIWNTETYEQISNTYPHKDRLGFGCSVHCLTHFENILVSADMDRIIRIWNIEIGEQIEVLRGHPGNIKCLIVHENKLYSGLGNGTGSENNTIRVWKI